MLTTTTQSGPLSTYRVGGHPPPSAHTSFITASLALTWAR
ncbi:hypothetical protein I545_4995 [Mycobacterium kansasii 662]|uniref:Uncharacterized protein n=1 Tax=Mycobacterium kansasii 662 TaxID=1299326 RepID=X7YZL2_MYCKA|nr:hypothetical protein I545_4995 [Mycobacterium kansasii 662]